jgi:hypothetical protein
MKTKRITLVICCMSAFCNLFAQSAGITDSTDRKAEAIALINMLNPLFCL